MPSSPPIVRLPVPSDAPEPARAPLPLWHRDLAVLDPQWADEAATVLDLLARSDQDMVQSNAIGAAGQDAALAYSSLLVQMKSLQDDTVADQNRRSAGWLATRWDGFKEMFITQDPLPQRMEELLCNRKTLVENTRNRLHGLNAALDLRAEADERAMELLARIPELEEKALQALEQSTLVLAQTGEDERFEVFRKREMEHRSAKKVPLALTIVGDQLRNAVMLGTPLRNTIDQFIEIEQENQNKFELSFSVHVSNLAILQGVQQSKRNADASKLVIQELKLPTFQALPPPTTAPTNQKKWEGSVSDLLPEYICLSQLAAREAFSKEYQESLSTLRTNIAKHVAEMSPKKAARARAEICSRISSSDPLLPMVHARESVPSKPKASKPKKNHDYWDDFFEEVKTNQAIIEKEIHEYNLALLNEEKGQAKSATTKPRKGDAKEEYPMRSRAGEFVDQYMNIISGYNSATMMGRLMAGQKDDTGKQLTEMFSGIALQMELDEVRDIVYLLGKRLSPDDIMCKKLSRLLPSGDFSKDLSNYVEHTRLAENKTTSYEHQAAMKWLRSSLAKSVLSIDPDHIEHSMTQLRNAALSASDPVYEEIKQEVGKPVSRKTMRAPLR